MRQKQRFYAKSCIFYMLYELLRTIRHIYGKTFRSHLVYYDITIRSYRSEYKFLNAHELSLLFINSDFVQTVILLPPPPQRERYCFLLERLHIRSTRRSLNIKNSLKLTQFHYDRMEFLSSVYNKPHIDRCCSLFACANIHRLHIYFRFCKYF